MPIRSKRIYFHVGQREEMYPRTYSLLGRIDEQRGDRRSAAGHYRRFLDLWKEADPDLPELLDARSRLARLGV